MLKKIVSVCFWVFLCLILIGVLYVWIFFEGQNVKKSKECEDFVLDPIALPSSAFTVTICFKSVVPKFLRLTHRNFTAPIFWSRGTVLNFQIFGYDCLAQLSSCTKTVRLKSGRGDDPFCVYVAVFEDLVLCYTEGVRTLTGGYLKNVSISVRELDYLFDFVQFWFKEKLW